jgi:hypothetical protein
LALPIHQPQIELRHAMALVGRLQIPLSRLRLVLARTLSAGELAPQVELRLGVPRLGGRLFCGGIQSRPARAAEPTAKKCYSHNWNTRRFCCPLQAKCEYSRCSRDKPGKIAACVPQGTADY